MKSDQGVLCQMRVAVVVFCKVSGMGRRRW